MENKYSSPAAIAALNDYSQGGEQEHILKACATISKGMFLDIGAYHPTDLSNTRALWELGWNGVLIEPSPRPMLSLIEEYGKDARTRLIAGLVVPGVEGGLLNLAVNDGPYSTTETRNFQRWFGKAEYRSNLLVPVIPLESILVAFGPFDFIDIDVEGGSSELFYRMLDLNVTPQCVCVEYDEHRAEIERRAEASGYKQVFSNAVNIIFARNT